MTEAEIESIVRSIDECPIDKKTVPQGLLDLEQHKRPSLFPWRGQFSPGFIEVMLANFAKSDDVVLDPFVGSGTTLFEAARRSMSCYGVEINPAAGELAKTVSFVNIPPSQRREYFEEAYAKVKTHLGAYLEPLFTLTEGTSASEPWENCLRGLLKDVGDNRLVGNIVLNSILRYYLARGTKSPYGFLQAFNQHKAIVEKLPYSERPCKFFLCDARSIPLGDGSIDFIITSPPYINVFNYHQNYRKIMELMGWDMLTVAESEIGSNRRNRGNRFLTVVEYSIDMFQALTEMRRLTHRNSRVVLVVGRESKVRGISFYNGQLLATLAVGGVRFDLILRQERRYVNRFGQVIYEDILHFVPNGEKPPINSVFALDVAKYALQKALCDVEGSVEIRDAITSAIEQCASVQRAPIFESSKATKEKVCAIETTSRKA